MTGRTAVIAIGGNSLIEDRNHQEVSDQSFMVRETCRQIADVIESGWSVVITHGNGPQVGDILRRNELARPEVPEISLDCCVAETQGGIGHILQQTLGNEFLKRGIQKTVLAIVTQVIVSPDDPAFRIPTKPVGSFFTETEARQHKVNDGWAVAEDAGRGWRRVVPSPMPQQIVEARAILRLLQSGFVVIAAGGGGIPVVRNEDGSLSGIAAVIDKDYVSALLAAEIRADLLVVSTGIEKVALNYGKPNQVWIDHMSVSEARRYLSEGQFAVGSMRPKIEAILRFLAMGGTAGVIASPGTMTQAIKGKTGTRITA